MIDVIISIYLNYDLLLHQINRWKDIKGDWRLLICDNTPVGLRVPIKVNEELKDKILVFTDDSNGIDGERHGGVLNYMVKQCTSDIICIQDSDYFWLDNDILSYVDMYFKNGYKCVGTELYYEGFEYVNEMYPERHGSLAPCIFGMFIDRELALSESFIVTKHEGQIEKRETGWRLRKKIIDENIKCHIIPCVQRVEQLLKNEIENIDKPWFYVGNHKYLGVHLCGGTSYNLLHTNTLIRKIFEFCGIQSL